MRKGSYSLSLSTFPTMAAQFLLLALAFAACTAAPQFSEDIAQTPYDFGYGVSVADTGDAKEHKETVSPSGRTEGEYRWLQPNGLYRVVRYYVEGDSGFQAEVSEEPGPDVANYYTNSLTQENSQGGTSGASSQNIAKSLDLRTSLGTAANIINVPRPASRPAARPAPRPFQGFRSQPKPQPQQTFIRQPQQQPQQTFITQPAFSGNIIDGGIIDGGIIDGGIIDGGIIDGGIINASYEDDRFSG